MKWIETSKYTNESFKEEFGFDAEFDLFASTFVYVDDEGQALGAVVESGHQYWWEANGYGETVSDLDQAKSLVEEFEVK